jgi:hypothetical protein
MPNRRIVIVGVAFGALATTALAGSIWLSGGSAPGPVTHQSTAVPTQSTAIPARVKGDDVLAKSKPCLTVAPMPGYLPAAVSGHTTACFDVSDLPVRREVTYTLAGSINADTIPSQDAVWDQDKLAAGAYHMRTDIVFVTWTHATALEPLSGDGMVIDIQPLSSGSSARVTTVPDGLGPVRVEWTSGGNTYLLMTTHSSTDQGPAGVPIRELLAMAGSVSG